jgi:hypothetical protein
MAISARFDSEMINFTSAASACFLIEFGLFLTTWRGLEI